MFGDFITRSIETGNFFGSQPSKFPELGLITAWTQRTWAGMREEYLISGEEKIVLPDVAQGGSVIALLLIALTCNVLVDPLDFEDVEGGFYLLGAGLALSIFVHVFIIFMIKMQTSCNPKKSL